MRPGTPSPTRPRRSGDRSARSRTRVPGVRINEHLPQLAARMDRLALIRSLHHDEAPIHETGLQLLQTGRMSRSEDENPHIGAVVSRLQGSSGLLPTSVMLPGPITDTGVKVPRGQTAGWLGVVARPFFRLRRPGRFRVPAPRHPRPRDSIRRGGRSKRSQTAIDHTRGESVRPERGTESRPRILWVVPLRAKLPAGATVGRIGRAGGDGEHVRLGFQRGNLGLPRLGTVRVL